jgi:hypothetical protein
VAVLAIWKCHGKWLWQWSILIRQIATTCTFE